MRLCARRSGSSTANGPKTSAVALEGDLAGALHILVPKAVPQAPDLGLGYSPN